MELVEMALFHSHTHNVIGFSHAQIISLSYNNPWEKFSIHSRCTSKSYRRIVNN